MKKLVLIVIISTLLKQLMFGQGGFSKNYFLSGSYVSVCKDVIEAPNGNIIMLGLTTTTTGYNRLTVVGADAQGNQLWRKDYGSNKFEYLDDYGIYKKYFLKASDCFYYYIAVKDSNNNYFSSFIKFTYSGDTLWQRKYYGTSEYLYIYDIIKSVDNGFLMTGEVEDIVNPTIKTLIIKTDSLGNELWRRKLSKTALPNAQVGENIIQDSVTKKIIITGFQYNGTASSYTGYANIIITDSLGIELQRKSYTGFCGGYFKDAVLTKDKNIVAVGFIDQCNNLGGVNGSSRYKGYAVKVNLNNLNNVLWSKEFDTLSIYNSFATINELKNGDLIISGCVDTLSNYNINSKAMLRLVKLDKNGNTIWNKKFSRENANQNTKFVRGLSITANGSYLIANELYYATNPRPYSITKIDSTGCDSTLAYCSTVGIQENSYLNEVIKLYPNPTNGIVNIEVENANKIEIINVLGELVKQEDLKFKQQSIDISSLQNGIYFLQVFNKDKLIGTTKIVKE